MKLILFALIFSIPLSCYSSPIIDLPVNTATITASNPHTTTDVGDIRVLVRFGEHPAQVTMSADQYNQFIASGEDLRVDLNDTILGLVRNLDLEVTELGGSLLNAVTNPVASLCGSDPNAAVTVRLVLQLLGGEGRVGVEFFPVTGEVGDDPPFWFLSINSCPFLGSLVALEWGKCLAGPACAIYLFWSKEVKTGRCYFWVASWLPTIVDCGCDVTK